MIRLIYFDLGEVFFDSKNFMAIAANHFKLSQSDFNEIFDLYDDQITRGTITVAGFWRLCIGKLNIPNTTGFNFAKSWVDDYLPIKEIYNLVSEIQSKYPIGIISNFYRGLYPYLITRQIIPDINYSSIIMSYDCGFRKPEIEIYRLAQSKAPCLPSEILFIDNKTENLVPPQSLGWHTYLFQTNNPLESIEDIKRILSRTP